MELKSQSFDICTSAGTGKITERQTIAKLASRSSHTLVFPVVPLAVGEMEIDLVLTTQFVRETVSKVVKVKVRISVQLFYGINYIDSTARGGRKRDCLLQILGSQW